MKIPERFFLLVLLISFLQLSFLQASNNYVFSVSSNPSINLGYKISPFIVNFGFDFSYNKVKLISNARTSSILPVESNNYSIFTIKPSIGLKGFIIQDEISPFLFIGIFKEIPVFWEASGSYNEDEIKDQNNDFYYNFGGGMDYSIKENLSLGVELGINYHKFDWDNTLWKTIDEHYSSFSRLTLNYYFL